MPYLFFYLLYPWLRWPVNPVLDGKPGPPFVGPLSPPPLIHVFWSLHGIHLLLAGRALSTWRNHRIHPSLPNLERKPAALDRL